MVRREGTAAGPAERSVEEGMSCCNVLAGASPVPVSTGAPGSRVQPWVERCKAERAVESLDAGSKEAGRNQVNAEQASSDYQPKGDWECRAGHVAAKAKHSACSNPVSALGLPGVLAAARFDRALRNTRDPSPQPEGQATQAYKAGAEIARGGAGVRGAHSTYEGGEKPLEGRGPASVTVGSGRKREGMAERPNNPTVKAREATGNLWRCAERDSRSAHAISGRPSVSRMREIRTYGLKGGPALDSLNFNLSFNG
jgi:hypothetical protein